MLMRKPLRGLITAFILIVISLAIAYFALVMYYRNGFYLNTWINGIYCTGSTVQEVNEQLLAQTVVPNTLTVVGYDRVGEDCEIVTWTISMEDIKYSIDYETNLNNYLSKQNPWVWIDNLTSRNNHVLQPSVYFDEIALLNIVDEMLVGFDAEESYRIEYTTEEGYVLYDGMFNRIDEEKVVDTIKNAVFARVEKINLIESGCYYDVPLNEEQMADYTLWKKIDAYQRSGPYYDFGDGKTQVSAAHMANFLEVNSATSMPFLDENGYFILREGFAQEWVRQMAEEHDTYGKTWDFVSTRGETLQIEGENYGTSINQEREADWFENYLRNLVEGSLNEDAANEGNEGNPRVPFYSKEAYYRSQELGDTYIEADLGSQKLYYYENGELLIETDIVSGNMRRGWDTPAGVNYVYSKQKNRVLRGQGYATPVKFWMPVDGAVGIHDADWRDEFGGEIYKTDGSHGCMNVPKEIMPQLYDLVELGTPVIMFYGTDPVTGETIE